MRLPRSLFAWTFQVHANLRSWSNPLLPPSATADDGPGVNARVASRALRHGWFGVGKPLGSEAQLGCDRSLGGLPSWFLTVCPNSSSGRSGASTLAISEFDLRDILDHRIMGGPYKSVYQTKAPKELRTARPELQLPLSPAHGLLLQQVLRHRAASQHTLRVYPDVHCPEGLPCLSPYEIELELAAHAQAWRHPPSCGGSSGLEHSPNAMMYRPYFAFAPRKPLLDLIALGGGSDARSGHANARGRDGHGVSSTSLPPPPVAVVITGLARAGFDCRRAQWMSQKLGLHPHNDDAFPVAAPDVFLHLGLEGASPRVLLEAVRLLRPVSYRFALWRPVADGRASSLCPRSANASALSVPWSEVQSSASCVAADSDDPKLERSVGCYAVGCTECDPRKYLPQTLRRLLGFRLMERHEATRGQRYRAIIATRIDAADWQAQALPRSLFRYQDPTWLDTSAVYVLSLRRFGSQIPDDNFAVLPRQSAEAYFGVFGSLTQCQRRSEGMAACGGTTAQWGWWATPECLLKVHLMRCRPASAAAGGEPVLRVRTIAELERAAARFEAIVTSNAASNASHVDLCRETTSGSPARRDGQQRHLQRAEAIPSSEEDSQRWPWYDCGPRTLQQGFAAVCCKHRAQPSSVQLQGEALPKTQIRRWWEFTQECAPVLDRWCESNKATCPPLSSTASTGMVAAVYARPNGTTGLDAQWRCERVAMTSPSQTQSNPRRAPGGAAAGCVRHARLLAVLRDCGKALLRSRLF